MSKVLYVVGSLRKGSFNKKLAERLNEVASGEVVTLHDMPFMDEDLEQDPPKAVSELREKVLAADKVVFVTPEYNYSIPGVLKNTIDWLSRPYGDNKPVLVGKTAYVVGASLSFVATARAQKELKAVLNMIGMNVKNDELCVFIDYSTGEWDKLADERIVKYAEGLK